MRLIVRGPGCKSNIVEWLILIEYEGIRRYWHNMAVYPLTAQFSYESYVDSLNKLKTDDDRQVSMVLLS